VTSALSHRLIEEFNYGRRDGDGRKSKSEGTRKPAKRNLELPGRPWNHLSNGTKKDESSRRAKDLRHRMEGARDPLEVHGALWSKKRKGGCDYCTAEGGR